MKEKFKTLPEALQWQILSRFAGGVGFFLLFIVIMIFYRNVYLWLPSLFFYGYAHCKRSNLVL